MAGDIIVVGAWLEDSGSTGGRGEQENNDAPDSGAAYVYWWNGTAWVQVAYLKATNPDPEDFFGSSISLFESTVVLGAWWEDSAATGVNGDQSDNSAPHSGAAYVYDLVVVVPGDLNGDGAVNGADLGVLLAAWGTSTPQADLNADGIVDGSDVGLMLANWTG